MSIPHRTLFLLAISCCAACTPKGGDAPDVATSAPDLKAPDTGSTADQPPEAADDAIALMARLGGLWVGAASQTPLGSFPIVAMDFRAADPNTLFARVDLDADNALRMALYIEQLGDRTGLVFRNGGLFTGLSRDTKTALESYDADTATWRFCEPTRGCEYLDATITFAAEDAMTLDVKVRDQPHMHWTATRKELRILPAAFPASPDPLGTGDAPFPTMPTLEVDLSWNDASPAGAWVWVILSDTACGITGQGCNASRSIGALVPEGSTSASLSFDQLHGGSYRLNAVLDRDGNFQTVPFPQTGDAVMFPGDAAISVASEGTTTTAHAISFDVP